MITTKNNLLKGLLALCVSCTLLFTIGCSSSSDLDFPDPNNPDQSTATIQLLVTGIESGSRNGLGIYLRAVDTMGRDTYYFEPSDPRYTGELLTGPIDPGGFITGTPWRSRYSVVKNCNILLERAAEKSDAGAAGFAKTLLAHEMLLNLGYMDTNGIRTDVATEVLGPIVSKAEALTFIASQLDSGYSDLQSAGSFSFNLTSGYAGFDTPAEFAKFNRGLRARVAAYENDWPTVLSAVAASFINASSPLDTQLGVYHVYSTGAGDQTNPVFADQSSTTIRYHVHESFISGAEAGDHRVTSKTSERDERTYDGLTSSHGFAVYTSQTAPIAIQRNEELVLLRAEANIQLGDLASAEADLNLIREAAGLGPVTLTASSALDQLIYERRYSLFGEGQRWIDMRRWGLLDTLPLDRAGDMRIDKMPIPTGEQQ